MLTIFSRLKVCVEFIEQNLVVLTRLFDYTLSGNHVSGSHTSEIRRHHTVAIFGRWCWLAWCALAGERRLVPAFQLARLARYVL